MWPGLVTNRSDAQVPAEKKWDTGGVWVNGLNEDWFLVALSLNQ